MLPNVTLVWTTKDLRIRNDVRNHASVARERILGPDGETIAGFLCTCGTSDGAGTYPSAVARPGPGFFFT